MIHVYSQKPKALRKINSYSNVIKNQQITPTLISSADSVPYLYEYFYGNRQILIDKVREFLSLPLFNILSRKNIVIM